MDSNQKMTYLKSFIFLFILVSVSNNVIAQDEKQNPITIIKKDKNEFRIDTSKLNSIYSSNYNSHLILILRNQINNSSNDRIKAPKADLAFNLNFANVDPLIYTGTGDNNLSLIRRGYESNYQIPNTQRTFTGDLIMSILESCLIK